MAKWNDLNGLKWNDLRRFSSNEISSLSKEELVAAIKSTLESLEGDGPEVDLPPDVADKLSDATGVSFGRRAYLKQILENILAALEKPDVIADGLKTIFVIFRHFLTG